MTSPVAVLEAALGLARPDKFGLSVGALEPLILEFLDERGIEIADVPPAMETTRLALSAAHRYDHRRGPPPAVGNERSNFFCDVSPTPG